MGLIHSGGTHPPAGLGDARAQSARLDALLDGVPARIWAADYRPSRAMADSLVGEGGDLAAYLAEHREAAIELYRAALPLWWNAEAARSYGLPATHPAELIAMVPHEAQELLSSALVDVLGGRPSGIVDFRVTRSDGVGIASQFSWITTGLGGDPLAEVLNISVDRADVLAEEQRRLRELAEAFVTDAVTGVRNRPGLLAVLGDLTEDEGAEDAAALLAFDVPGFHAINDVYGHEVGDACLRAIGAALSGAARPGDVVARIGGDQFAVLVRGDRAVDVRAEAARFAGVIDASTVDVGRGLAVDLGVVAGIASANGIRSGARSGEEVLADIDIALSRAKRTRTTAHLVEADAAAYRAEVATRLEWGRRVSEAIEADTLAVVAQPLVHLERGGVVGFEALVRLRDGDDLIPASAFMPDIQLLGMTPVVDRWMVRRVIALLAQHADLVGDRRVGVNVSATTLVDGNLLQVIDDAVRETGGDPRRLVIEMVETEVLDRPAVARAVVEGLHERGVEFALDDFGSGAAVPMSLRELPVDWIKIDGHFVRDAVDSPLGRAVVAGVVAIADAMGARVVAEWVEDAATADLMREMGVRLGQGFFMGMPTEIPAAFAMK